jgi:hypothetical protein
MIDNNSVNPCKKITCMCLFVLTALIAACSGRSHRTPSYSLLEYHHATGGLRIWTYLQVRVSGRCEYRSMALIDEQKVYLENGVAVAIKNGDIYINDVSQGNWSGNVILDNKTYAITEGFIRTFD